MLVRLAVFAGLILFVHSPTSAEIITVDHNITRLPPSGSLETDLDGDGVADINLASNYYVSTRNRATEFTTPYSRLGDVIDANTPWRQGNTWLDLHGNVSNFVQDDLLYLGVRNTSTGPYYGYITFNLDRDSFSVSLNSYTYDNSGSPITVSDIPVPEPAAGLLLGIGCVCSPGMLRRRAE